jgi:hypothetical protein
MLEGLAEDAFFERFDVDDDVGELRHGDLRGVTSLLRLDFTMILARR